MASPRMRAQRTREDMLGPSPEYIIKRVGTPIGKTGLMRMRTAAAPGIAVDPLTGVHTNPARAMSEAERRAAGLSRNGQPRRRKAATA